MAAATGTYRAVGGSNTPLGLREDLTDIISNISYTVTPYLTSLGKATAKAVTHEWQNDTLRAATANAKPEGNEPTFAEPTATTRLKNTCQIFQEQLIVSGTLDKVSKAGRKTELGYQLTKKLKEYARDQELAFMLESENTSDPRRMKGLEAWITTNAVAAGAVALDEVHIDSAMELVWNITGESSDFRALMSSFQKKKVTAFTGHANTSMNIDLSAKKLINSVSVYEGDFGVLFCVPHTMLGTNQTAIRGGGGFDPRSVVMLYQPEYCKKASLRPTKTEPLAKTGDATKRHIVGEETLQMQNELSAAKITGLTIA